MKYLFFDLECSDGRHVCSFGYVLTDENFSVIEKKDILINPEAIFHTGAWSKAKREKNERDRGITLAYPKEEFVASPKFDYYYDLIKSLLTDKDNLVVGFACDNDARFINWACDRYKLPYFSYVIYDMQRAYREYKELTNQPSLDKALVDLSVDVSEHVAHRSDEDAEVTMLVAKGLCDRLGISLKELIEKYPPCEGVVADGKIEFKHAPGSVCDGGRYTGSNNLRRNYKVFQTHMRKTKPKRGATLPLKGEKVCFSTVFEDKHFTEMLLLIDLVADNGGKCVTRASEASIYVTVDSPNKVCRRERIINERLKKSARIRKVDIDKFLSMLGSSYESLLENGAEFRKNHIGKILE
ncbi:MAG: hypothetical protein IJ033_02760 [Clostridia bacterium]|nr:hypothetical protein [Clostridia bacterium]